MAWLRHVLHGGRELNLGHATFEQATGRTSDATAYLSHLRTRYLGS